MRRTIAALALALVAATAHAAPAPPELRGIRVLDTTALELAGLTVDLDCHERKRYTLTCRATSRYVIANPTGESVTVRISAPEYEPYSVLLDGAPVTSAGWLEITVAPGATRTLTIDARVTHEPWRGNMALAFDPLVIRHPLLGQYYGPGWLPPLYSPEVDPRPWARVGQATFTARYPASWDRMTGWTHNDDGGQRVATFVRPIGDQVSFDLSRSAPSLELLNGGPYIELGGTFGDGFRARVGYEIGFRSTLLASVSAGTNFRDDLIVTPLVEFATPNIFLIPSLGLGFGAPVRVLPETEVGMRFQLVATFPVGFITTFDYWPDDDQWATTLSARIGI